MISFWRRLPAVTLLAGFGFLISACGGKEAVSREDLQAQAFYDLRAAVEGVIEEQTRKEAALAVVDELEAGTDALRASLNQRRSELRRLHVDYDTTREELEAFTDSIERQIRTNHSRVSSAHQSLIAETTPQEWAALSKADTKAMNAIANSLRGI